MKTTTSRRKPPVPEGAEFWDSADTEEDGQELLEAATETIRNLGRSGTHYAFVRLYWLSNRQPQWGVYIAPRRRVRA